MTQHRGRSAGRPSGSGWGRRGPAFAAGIALTALAGCGGGETSKQLDALRAELGRLRAENATLEARVESLEAARATLPPSSSADAREPSGDADRPDLDVVRVGPELGHAAGSLPAIDPERPGDEARVVLRSGPGGAVVEVAAPPEASPVEDAAKVLEQAQELYRAKKYERAIEILAVLTARFPSHPKAEEALLLRADCYAAKNEHRRALELYGEVERAFPGSPRAGEALQRMARSYDKLGDATSAARTRAKLKELGKTSSP